MIRYIKLIPTDRSSVTNIGCHLKLIRYIIAESASHHLRDVGTGSGVWVVKVHGPGLPSLTPPQRSQCPEMQTVDTDSLHCIALVP